MSRTLVSRESTGCWFENVRRQIVGWGAPHEVFLALYGSFGADHL